MRRFGFTRADFTVVPDPFGSRRAVVKLWTHRASGVDPGRSGDTPVSVDERPAVERNAGLRKFVAARGARLSPVLSLLTGRRSDLRPDLPLALVASATAWLTMASWRSFSSDWGAFLWPLLAIALISSLGGVALRSAPLSRN